MCKEVPLPLGSKNWGCCEEVKLGSKNKGAVKSAVKSAAKRFHLKLKMRMTGASCQVGNLRQQVGNLRGQVGKFRAQVGKASWQVEAASWQSPAAC